MIRKLNWIKNKGDLEELKALGEIQLQKNDLRVQEKKCEQNFYYESYEVFGLDIKANKGLKERLLKDSSSATKISEEMKDSVLYVKAMELVYKNAINDTYSTRPSANLIKEE